MACRICATSRASKLPVRRHVSPRALPRARPPSSPALCVRVRARACAGRSFMSLDRSRTCAALVTETSRIWSRMSWQGSSCIRVSSPAHRSMKNAGGCASVGGGASASCDCKRGGLSGCVRVPLPAGVCVCVCVCVCPCACVLVRVCVCVLCTNNAMITIRNQKYSVRGHFMLHK